MLAGALPNGQTVHLAVQGQLWEGKAFYAMTGIKWVEKGAFDCDYVHFSDERQRGCSSNVGKIRGPQIFNLCKISGP